MSFRQTASGDPNTGFAGWFDLQRLDQVQIPGNDALRLFRETLKSVDATLEEHFGAGVSADQLVYGRSWAIDQILVRAWSLHVEKTDLLALVAVGGYGRGELLPRSDIDLLILLPDGDKGEQHGEIEIFLAFLWDIGLEVGHSVRTITDCVEQSREDITVVTNLMEARLIDGSHSLFNSMRLGVAPDRIWPCRDFFAAKLDEQRRRYRKYDNTAYKLEPNVKEGPGGLRDIQMIGWVAKRYFGAGTLQGLVGHDFLTSAEYESLINGQTALWRIRFALHVMTGRGEDRILFDYQRSLADSFGYHDQDNRLAVESFMKDYFRNVMELNRLNEMLLQLFQEAILYADDSGDPVPINRRFQSRKGFIEISDESVFSKYPFALLEIFLLLAQRTELKGVRASTIRSIRDHRHLIDENFRRDIRSRSLFMEIIRQPKGLTHELRRMNGYGVLAAYLPAFSKIVGQMQYDLFHVYTVDEHTLFVVRNLRRFTVPEFTDELPQCSRIMGTIPKPELLYLAGLFHDIAKGRGGDHSELGCHDAEDFCRSHGLSEYDTELVSWLVLNHLIMSTTAQRQDISDPLVINDFARLVSNPVRLDYLYLLTVADIRGTNPSLWNTWKDSLLKQLYSATRQALRRGLDNPLERNEHIQQVRACAQDILEKQGLMAERIGMVWDIIGDDYFLRHTPEQIARHTVLISQHEGMSAPLIDIHQDRKLGGTEIFIHLPVRDDHFTKITTVLDRLGLTVVDAKVMSSVNGYSMDSYLILDESGKPVDDNYRIGEIRSTLINELEDHDWIPADISRRPPREFRHFPIQTRIDFKTDLDNQRTVLELITADRPGLLSIIGRAFMKCGVRIHNARIATFGTRAEDVFYITDKDDQVLGDEAQIECLRTTLLDSLNEDTI